MNLDLVGKTTREQAAYGKRWFAYGEGTKDGKTYLVCNFVDLKTEQGALNRVKHMAYDTQGIELYEAHAVGCWANEQTMYETAAREQSTADVYVTYHGDLYSCLACTTDGPAWRAGNARR